MFVQIISSHWTEFSGVQTEFSSTTFTSHVTESFLNTGIRRMDECVSEWKQELVHWWDDWQVCPLLSYLNMSQRQCALGTSVPNEVAMSHMVLAKCVSEVQTSVWMERKSLRQSEQLIFHDFQKATARLQPSRPSWPRSPLRSWRSGLTLFSFSLTVEVFEGLKSWHCQLVGQSRRQQRSLTCSGPSHKCCL